MSSPVARGGLIARRLHRSWRRELPSAADEAVDVAALLVASGAAGLAARGLAPSTDASAPWTAPLHDARRHQAIMAAVVERQLAEALTCLRRAGVEPLLAKGWASERLYPERGLRPVGDVDLYVRPREYATARAALAGATLAVDLHRGAPELPDRSLHELWLRSRIVVAAATGIEVRLFSAEDELRLVALHFLKHGATRPTGLVDVALALEARGPDFDWDYFLSGDARRSEWALATLGLAERLLGARLDHPPVVARARRMPEWLPRAVLAQWGAGFRQRDPIAALAGLELVATLLRRWPNPIEASVGVGAPFDGTPRLPIQLAACVLRIAGYARLRWRHRGRGGLPIVGAPE